MFLKQLQSHEGQQRQSQIQYNTGSYAGLQSNPWEKQIQEVTVLYT